MLLLSRTSLALGLAALTVASAATAQTPVAADMVMAVDNGNGTSTLVSYLGDYGNAPGTWTATTINQDITGSVLRITQDCNVGSYFTLSTTGTGFFVEQVESPHTGGYGAIFSTPPQATSVFSTSTLQLTDIKFDRSVKGMTAYGRSLVLLGVSGGDINLTRINLGGGVLRATAQPTNVPANASASMAIDPNTGDIFVGTDMAQLASFTVDFSPKTPATVMNPVVAVGNMSWNDRGLGATSPLTVAGVDGATGSTVVRRYNTNGASAQSAIYSGSDALIDLAVDPSGHIYSLRSAGGLRSMDRFHTATHAPAPPSAPLPALLRSSSTAMAFSTRAAALARVYFATGINHTHALYDSVRIGAALPPGSPFPEIDVTLLALPGGAPGAPLDGDPTWLHFSSAYLNPPIFIPGLGWLALNVGAPGFFTSSMTPVFRDITTNYRPTARVKIPFTPNASHNGYVCWVQLQISPDTLAVPVIPPLLADCMSSFTIGFEPVE